MSNITPDRITEMLKEKGISEELKAEEPKAEVKEEEHAVQEEKESSVEKEEAVVLEESSEVSEVEQEAMSKGWKPEGEKSAEEFLRAEPLYEEIKTRGKEIKALRAQMDELVKHMGDLRKSGYQDKMDAIKAEREDAVIRSDVESVNYYDEELQKLNKEMEDVVSKPSIHPAITEFDNKHADLVNDYSLKAQEIKSFISERAQEIGQYTSDPELLVKTLEKDLEFKFPERFSKKEEQAKPARVQSVESDLKPVTSKRKAKFSVNDLNHTQKNIYKYMERKHKELGKGYMSGEDYIKQLIDTGELS